MPSPFPGMDPYLETQPMWSDFHATFTTALKSALKKRLPAGYSVWADVYIWLHEPDAETRKGKPDVFVSAKKKAVRGATVATKAPPATSILPAIRREGNKYLKIKEVGSDHVITAIEILGPANKEPGEFRDAYVAKRNEYLATGTNLVEIDLLRAGQRMNLGQPAPAMSDYYVLICRATDFPRTAIWPFSLREPLPEIPIPLKPVDGSLALDLQESFLWAYEQGPYDTEIDYAKPPKPALRKSDEAWARNLLAARK